MRDEEWLKEHLKSVKSTYFPEITDDHIEIIFDGRSRDRLGSIRHKGYISQIKVNSRLASEKVPEMVVTEVIAHELVHYVHGFGSNRPRLHRYPHRGGVVAKELEGRGAGHLISYAKMWLDKNWHRHSD